MSTYTDASLIVTPNAYKAGKLYSLKPTEGTGDLDVVRATSATRVNEQGLIEIPRTNLLLRSEEFDNAYWNKLASSIIANATTSPSGNLTADKLVEDTSASAHRFISTSFSTINGVSYTISIFFKKAGRDYAYIRLNNSGGDIIAANINLLNGTVSQSIFGNITIIPYNNDWYRVIATGTSISTSNGSFEVRTSNSATYANYTGNGTSGIFVWGAQLEVGDVATEYIPTTSVIRTRFAGITQDGGSASNIPRIDYTNGSCPSILVEPQRTNLFLRSEEFDNSYWNKAVHFTITQNSILSPSGTMTADTITPNNTLTNHWIGRTGFTLVSGTTYAFSVFAKNNGYNLVLSVGDSTVYTNCNFNLNNGTTSTPLATSGANLCSPLIQNFGNGWYRCTIIFTAWTASNFLLYSVNNTNSTPLGSFGMAVIAGNNVNGFYLWGAQLEAGSNTTSYIPTVASAVTRNADVISKTGIADLIGQVEGTIFFDGKINALPVDGTLFGIQKNASNFVIRFGSQGKNIYAQSYKGSANLFFEATSYTLGSRVKAAFAYKAGSYAFYINGVQIATGSNATAIPACDSTMLNSLWGNFNDSVSFYNVNALWKTRLSNTELSTLTTI